MSTWCRRTALSLHLAPPVHSCCPGCSVFGRDDASVTSSRPLCLPPFPRSSIPVRFKPGVPGPEGVEVLLISSRRGKGDVFPKGGWEVSRGEGRGVPGATCCL